MQLGEEEAGNRIDSAIRKVLPKKQYRTRDVGGEAGTDESTSTPIEAIE